MRYYILIFLLITGFSANAQLLKGIVIDGETQKPLFPVVVVNLATHLSTYTDEHGVYTIAATNGDNISFSYVGYATIQRGTPPAIGIAEMNVSMQLKNFQLPEYVLHNYTQYQKDSIAMREEYAKELNVAPIKPQVGFNNGLAVNGLIGSAVQKMSRGYKKSEKFKEEFKKGEEDRFIDTRYTPVLVGSLTNFTGDTLAAFMNTYPMDYTFARAASDLEIKMWIRYNYKQYIHKKKDDTEGLPVAATPQTSTADSKK